MKKNKLAFLIVTFALALSALVGCGNEKPSSVTSSSVDKSEPPSSSVLPSSSKDIENNYYVVKQNFTADIYIKLKYGEDKVWLSFKS